MDVEPKIVVEPRKWSQEETYDLISFYRELRVLWDPSNRDYGLKSKRAEAIAALAEKFTTTESEINRKIHNLRCQFRGEVRNFNKKCNGNDNCTSGWQFFDMMKEIMNYSATTRNSNSVATRTNFKRKTNKSAIDYGNQLISAICDNDMISFARTSNSNDVRHALERQSSDEKRRKTQTSVEAFENLFNPNPSSLDIQPIDENQLFGDYVAHELRQLRKENQRMAKLRIARVLLEMGEAENTPFPPNQSLY